MATIRKIKIDNIDSTSAIYYCGWSNAEIEKYHRDFQTKFLGFADDLKLEVTTDEGETYFVIFHAGDKYYKHYRYLLLEEYFGILVNANGKIYRFDIQERKNLDIECYGKDLHLTIFNESISQMLGLMVVKDSCGIAALSWDKFLWRKDFSYIEELNIQPEFETSISIEYNPPDDSTQYLLLDALTGEIK